MNSNEVSADMKADSTQAPDAKAQWRRKIRQERRENYSGAAIVQSARELHPHVAALIESVAAQSGRPLTIAGFSPMGPEASAIKALREAARAGYTVLLPTFAGNMLGWREWDGVESLQPSGGAKFGAEPTGRDHGPEGLADADLILAPAVALDRSGTRLGHGKGYYDRALVHMRPDATLAAVIHRTELLPAGSLPRDEHDVPFTQVVTEDGLIALGQG